MTEFKRKVVVYENTEPYPGTFFSPGCFKVKEDIDELYVGWGGFEHPPIGKAKDFERDKATGAISFNIKFFDPMYESLPEGHYDFTIYADELVEYQTSEMRIILSATIRGIYLHGLAGYPRTKHMPHSERSNPHPQGA